MQWVPRKRLPVLLLAALATLPCLPRAAAVTGGPDDRFGSNAIDNETAPAIERRRPSFFHSPSMDTPAEQLALADRLRDEGRLRRARRAYRALLHEWNDSDEAVRGQMAYAEMFEAQGKWLRAFDEYQRMIKFYVGRFDFDEVLGRQTALAEKVATMRHGRFLGLPGWEDPLYAIPLFETLLSNAPRSDRAPGWQFRIGEIQEEDGELEKAVRAYELVGTRYPESPLAEQASLRRALCLYRIALRRHARSERALQEAIGAFESLVEAFPRSRTVEETRPRMEEMIDRLAELHYQRALFYDRTAHQPTAACLAYLEFLKRFPTSVHAVEASARVEALRKETQTHDTGTVPPAK